MEFLIYFLLLHCFFHLGISCKNCRAHFSSISWHNFSSGFAWNIDFTWIIYIDMDHKCTEYTNKFRLSYVLHLRTKLLGKLNAFCFSVFLLFRQFLKNVNFKNCELKKMLILKIVNLENVSFKKCEY